MQDARANNNNEFLARFLRDTISDSIAWISNWERDQASDEGGMSREERMSFERWVRFNLTTRLIPDVLAAACGVFDYSGDVLNEGMPSLVREALTPVPTDVEFIRDMMARLPDDERTRRLSEVVGQGDDLAEIAAAAFGYSLYYTMDVEDPEN